MVQPFVESNCLEEKIPNETGKDNDTSILPEK